MKLNAKGVFWCCVGIWVLVLLPWFIPALNVLEPKVLGLPFTVFWQYLALALHLILCIVCSVSVWDAFDAKEEKNEH